MCELVQDSSKKQRELSDWESELKKRETVSITDLNRLTNWFQYNVTLTVAHAINSFLLLFFFFFCWFDFIFFMKLFNP